MDEEFQRPFAAPPTIFLGALLVSALLEYFVPFDLLPASIELTLGPLVIIVGVLLIRSTFREFKEENTTYDPFDISTNLVTSGVYQYSRNPGYLGLVIIQLGLAIVLGSIWVALSALVAALITSLFVIRLEEKKLADAFGESYLEYKSKVRRWF
ncbi:MAG: isoprenylcysteine carboxylmethyltransferase family protein [Paracoccaceae bacterium]